MSDKCGSCSKYSGGQCMEDGHEVDRYDDACGSYEE